MTLTLLGLQVPCSCIASKHSIATTSTVTVVAVAGSSRWQAHWQRYRQPQQHSLMGSQHAPRCARWPSAPAQSQKSIGVTKALVAR